MKKLKFLPSALMIVACLAVLVTGVFAANPTQNLINGNLSVNSSHPEVIISVYKYGSDGFRQEYPFIPETTVRSGVTLDLGYMYFNTPAYNNEEELSNLDRKFCIKIENPTSTKLGVYFSDKPMTGPATSEDVIKQKALTDSTNSTANVKAIMDGYLELSAKNADVNGVVNTNLTIKVLNFVTDGAIMDFDDPANSLYLNIEEYNEEAIPKDDEFYQELGYNVLGKGEQTLTSSSIAGTQITEYTKISDTITKIDANAFNENTNLKHLVIPSSVVSIASSAFRNCTNLESVVFERNSKITTLGAGGDAWSTDYGSYDDNNGIFRGCSNLVSVDMSNLVNLKTIGCFAFSRCAKLTNVKIPESLEEIGGLAFYGAPLTNSLVEIDGIKYLGSKTNPKHVIHSVTSEFRSNVTSFEIPAETKIIYYYAFSSAKLKDVVIPKTLKSIGPASFAYAKIRRIFIPSNIIMTGFYDSDAWMSPFYYCYDDQVYNGGAYELVNPIRVITDTETKPQAWTNNSMKISFEHSFELVTGVTYEQYYQVINGQISSGEIFNKVYGYKEISVTGTQITANQFKNNKTLVGTVAIPAGVTSIGESAFEGCTNITGVIIPSSVSVISDRAFMDCSGLKEVIFGNNTNLTALGSIEKNTYYQGPSLNFYQSSVFANCTELTSIDLSGCTNLKTLGDCIFEGCSKLISLSLPDSIEEVGIYAFNCNNLTLNEIDGIKYLPGKTNPKLILCAISSNIKQTITSYEIPAETKVVYQDAFSGARSLAQVKIPSTVKQLCPKAFQNTAIRNIFVPSSVKMEGYTYIDETYGVFDYCCDTTGDQPSNPINIYTDSQNTPSNWASSSTCVCLRYIYGPLYANIVTGKTYSQYLSETGNTL